MTLNLSKVLYKKAGVILRCKCSLSDPQIIAKVRKFFSDENASLKNFSKLTGDERKLYEQFISNEILPSLEGSRKTEFEVIEACMTLSKLSCIRNSPTLTKHVQYQLLHLVGKAGTNPLIKEVEKILREPLIKADSVFNDDGPVEKELRLGVYSRVIAGMVASVASGHLPLTNISDKDMKELRQVLEILKKLSKDVAVKKRDQLRYSVEFIQEGISRVRTGKKCTDSNLTAYFEKCNAEGDVKDIDLLNTIGRGKMHWFDLHMVMYYIHSMVSIFLVAWTKFVAVC